MDEKIGTEGTEEKSPDTPEASNLIDIRVFVKKRFKKARPSEIVDFIYAHEMSDDYPERFLRTRPVPELIEHILSMLDNPKGWVSKYEDPNGPQPPELDIAAALGLESEEPPKLPPGK